MSVDALDLFSPATRAWFSTTFAELTPPQSEGWPVIARGDHALIVAPTGSGKTLAAFLAAIDRLAIEPVPPKTRALPRPLRVAAARARRRHREEPARAARGHRAGGRTARRAVPRPDRRRAHRRHRDQGTPALAAHTARHPDHHTRVALPHAHVAGTRHLAQREPVIIDEIHALAPTKRGAHLALSLERLDAITDRPAATHRPVGHRNARSTRSPASSAATTTAPRGPVTIVDAGTRKELDIEVIVPVDDMANSGGTRRHPARRERAASTSAESRTSIWPHVHPPLLELVRAHRTTIVFTNARRLAERLAARLNELAGEELRARASRLAGTRATPAGRGRAQGGPAARDRRHEQPRARHRHGHRRSRRARRVAGLGGARPATDRPRRPPGRRAEHGQDLPEVPRRPARDRGRGARACARASSRRCATRATRSTCSRSRSSPRVAVDEWDVDELPALVRARARTSPSSPTKCSATRSTCSPGATPPTSSPGSGRGWCGTASQAASRRAQARSASRSPAAAPSPTAACSACSCPTARGSASSTRRWCTRAGSARCFVLGAATWRIEEITHDRVVVTPAPGEPAKMPFWKGDKPGRPLELGRALGALVRELRVARRAGRSGAVARRRPRRPGRHQPARLPRRAGRGHRRRARRPHDRGRALPRRDRRLAGVHAHAVRRAGARALGARDRGAAARTARPAPCECSGATTASSCACPKRSTSSRSTSMLARPRRARGARGGRGCRARRCSRHASARTRPAPCCCRAAGPASARRCGSSASAPADLLEVAARYPTFPILLETTRECLRDVFDLPALREVLTDVRSRQVRVVRGRDAATPRRSRSRCSSAGSPCTCTRAMRRSPNAGLAALGARPRPAARPARRRGAARAARPGRDRRPRARAATARARAPRPPRRRPRTICCRSRSTSTSTRSRPLHRRRPAVVARAARRAAGDPRADRRRGALRRGRRRGPAARRARLRAPAGLAGRVHRPGRPPARRSRRPLCAHARAVPSRRCRRRARRRRPSGRAPRSTGSPPPDAWCTASSGPGRPSSREWCDDGVLRVAAAALAGRACGRRSSRSTPAAFVRFLPGVAGRRTPAAAAPTRSSRPSSSCRVSRSRPSVLERDVLASRVAGYRPAMLDELCAAGELVWTGAGALATMTAACGCSSAIGVRLLAPAVVSPPDSRDGLHDASPRRARQVAVRSGPISSRPPEAPTKPCCSPRCGTSCGRARSRTTRSAPLRASGAAVPASGSVRRPDAGRLSRLGPPAGAGRWSLVAAAARARPAATAMAHATALQLLERHGVVTREAVHAEGTPGGFAGVYPVLRALEDAGKRAPRLVRCRARRRGVRHPGRGRPAALVPQPEPDDPPRRRARGDRSRPAVRGGADVARASRRAPPPARSVPM